MDIMFNDSLPQNAYVMNIHLAIFGLSRGGVASYSESDLNKTVSELKTVISSQIFIIIYNSKSLN